MLLGLKGKGKLVGTLLRSSRRSGTTSPTSSIMAGQVLASTTRPGRSVLVAIQTSASGSQRASMVSERVIAPEIGFWLPLVNPSAAR